MTDLEHLPFPASTDIEAEVIPAPPPPPPVSQPQSSNASFGEFVWEILQTLVMAGLLIVFFRTFVFQNYVVEGNSMLETLHPDERVIVSRLSYLLGEPQRGDIIVFEYPFDPSRDFVKRIIGMPGETISIRNNQIYINGVPLPPEEYVTYKAMAPKDPVTLGPDQYFVMGDNRPGSSDSRSWGPLNKRFIIGKAWMVYLPLNRLHVIAHPHIEPGT